MNASLPAPEAPPFRIMFVCTGNICRSPMAEVVLRAIAERAGLAERVCVESAGTGEWHVGERADQRTLAALERRNYNANDHRAKQFDAAELANLDLVVVFDRSQERILINAAANDFDRTKVTKLLTFDADLAPLRDVPDPYYSDDAMFDRVLEMIEVACRSLFRQLAPALRSTN